MDVDTKSTLKVQDVYQKGVSWQCPWWFSIDLQKEKLTKLL